MDWMYKGLTGLVDREEYLLGRKVDKTFDVMQAAEEQEKKQVDIISGDGLPSQLFRRKNYDTDFVEVDMACKVREDPLCMMRKQEYELKKQLLSNPVQMKMLQEMIAKEKTSESKKSKKSKKKKKKDSSGEDSDIDENDMDAKIAKYREKSLKSSSSREVEDDHDRKRPSKRQSPSESGSRSKYSREDLRDSRTRTERSSPKRAAGSPESPRRRKHPEELRQGAHSRRQRSRSPKHKQDFREQNRRNSRSPVGRRRPSTSPETEKRSNIESAPIRKRHEGFGLLTSSTRVTRDDGYVKKDYRAILEERLKKKDEERRELQRRLRDRQSRKMTQEEREKKLRRMQQAGAALEERWTQYLRRHNRTDSIDVEGYEEGGYRGPEMLARAVDSSSVEMRLKMRTKGLQKLSRAMETNF